MYNFFKCKDCKRDLDDCVCFEESRQQIMKYAELHPPIKAMTKEPIMRVYDNLRKEYLGPAEFTVDGNGNINYWSEVYEDYMPAEEHPGRFTLEILSVK